jgi:hypothetical protein
MRDRSSGPGALITGGLVYPAIKLIVMYVLLLSSLLVREKITSRITGRKGSVRKRYSSGSL